MPLLIAFIVVPLVEIALFIQVGGAIGLWWTLATVLVTAFVGATLVRQQGADILARLQSSLNSFSDPTTPLAEGAMVLFSGALLLTPGFFTDAVGFALLVPGIRRVIIDRVRVKLQVRAEMQRQHAETRNAHAPGQGPIIDGDYEPAQDPSKKDPSGWTRH